MVISRRNMNVIYHGATLTYIPYSLVTTATDTAISTARSKYGNLLQSMAFHNMYRNPLYEKQYTWPSDHYRRSTHSDSVNKSQNWGSLSNKIITSNQKEETAVEKSNWNFSRANFDARRAVLDDLRFLKVSSRANFDAIRAVLDDLRFSKVSSSIVMPHRNLSFSRTESWNFRGDTFPGKEKEKRKRKNVYSK